MTHRIVLLVAVFVFAPLTVSQEPPERPQGTMLPSVRCGDFFLVETMIEGEGPFFMLLDTGASITTLTSETRRRASPGRHIGSVEIGSMRVSGRMRYQTNDLEDISRAIGHKLDGILGHQVFQNVLLTYDYPAGEIRFRLGKLQDSDPGVSPMSTSKRPHVGALVGDRKINILLDTGFSGAIALKDFDSYAFESDPVMTGVIMRYDGAYLSRAGRLEEDMTFGSFVLERPVVRTAQGDSLLGQTILRDFVVTVDQKRGRVQIVRPDGSAAEAPISAASWIGSAIAAVPHEKGLSVVRVDPESPSSDAGLEVDDVITLVNGRPVGESLCEPRTERAAGERSMLSIERDGEPMELEIEHRVLVE